MAAVSSTSTASSYFSSQPQLPISTADPAASRSRSMRQPRRSSSFVMVEASSASGSDGGVARTKSLTEDDLEELKGCLDLGFGFAYCEIPELCGTLPALELCYSMTRRFLDEQKAPGQEEEVEPASPPLPNWRISGPEGTWMIDTAGFYLPFWVLSILWFWCYLNSIANENKENFHHFDSQWRNKGDDPEEVKARLKYWAQAVACTVKLCS